MLFIVTDTPASAWTRSAHVCKRISRLIVFVFTVDILDQAHPFCPLRPNTIYNLIAQNTEQVTFKADINLETVYYLKERSECILNNVFRVGPLRNTSHREPQKPTLVFVDQLRPHLSIPTPNSFQNKSVCLIRFPHIQLCDCTRRLWFPPVVVTLPSYHRISPLLRYMPRLRFFCHLQVH